MSATNPDSLPPSVIAGADQELAAADESLNELIEVWRTAQPMYDTARFDRLSRIGVFAVGTVSFTPYTVALLAIAVERLGGAMSEPTIGEAYAAVLAARNLVARIWDKEPDGTALDERLDFANGELVNILDDLSPFVSGDHDWPPTAGWRQA